MGEIIKDRFWLNEAFDGYIYQLPSNLRRIFGPKKTYSPAESRHNDNAWNLGHAKIKRNQDLIIRGAPEGSRDAGIFSVTITSKQDKSRNRGQVGFRCIYIP